MQTKLIISKNSASLILPAYREHCLVYPLGADAAQQQALSKEQATVINRFVFGGGAQEIPDRPAREQNTWPTYWLYRHDGGQTAANVYAAQLTALAGIETRPVIVDGQKRGIFYEDADAAYCRLGGILPPDGKASRSEQTAAVFLLMQRALQQCGMQFTDTVRTWLYLDKLLDWYAEFNSVRTGFFKSAGIFEHVVPASTGIGIANAAGCALCAGLIAIRPKSGRVNIREVASPLQCSAQEYRSSFSRALEVALPTHRTLYISGTASIDSAGNSVHQGNPEKQIERTLKVVGALLQSRGMSWEAACRGIVYYTDRNNHRLFMDYCRAQKIPEFPLAIAQADVCRRDLLFEIELDAVQAG